VCQNCIFAVLQKIFVTLLLLGHIYTFGQSKKEQITILQSKLEQCHLQDSLFRKACEEKLNKYSDYIDQLKAQQSLLEKHISSLNDSLKQDNEQRNSLYNKLTLCNQALRNTRDSLEFAQQELADINLASNNNQTGDFLNNYYINRQPINTTLGFQLAKIVTFNGDPYYNSNSIPNIHNANEFYLRYVPDGKDLSKCDEKTLMEKKNISFVNKLMPSIEILKNKLVTMNYRDGKDENLLFNLTNKPLEVDESLEIRLTSEEVNNSYEGGDIAWSIRQINNDTYLALSWGQLKRLGVKLSSEPNKITYLTSKGYEYNLNISALPDKNYSNKPLTAIERCWLFRKRNHVLTEDTLVESEHCIFLFKLTEEG